MPSSEGPKYQALDFFFEVAATRKGTVKVTNVPNDDPVGYGCDLIFPEGDWKGFPVCQADLTSTGAKGYGSMYGWVQLTRAKAPNEEESHPWEMDPVPANADLNTPFVWFGPEARLFDAPMQTAKELDWTCHSFLAWIPSTVMTKDVRYILGFEWGFWKNSDSVKIKPLRKLEPNEWDEHVSMFRDLHPGWKFAEAGSGA